MNVHSITWLIFPLIIVLSILYLSTNLLNINVNSRLTQPFVWPYINTFEVL